MRNSGPGFVVVCCVLLGVGATNDNDWATSAEEVIEPFPQYLSSESQQIYQRSGGNVKHLLRGRRSPDVFVNPFAMEDSLPRISRSSLNHLLRGRRGDLNHFLRGRRDMNHFLRGRKANWMVERGLRSSANHLLRGKKSNANHLLRGRRASEDEQIRVYERRPEDVQISAGKEDLIMPFEYYFT